MGYGNDKGGNDYQVQYNGKGTNLQHIWDSEIIESQNITLASLIGDEPPPIVGESPIDILRKVPIDFARELEAGRKLLPLIYDIKGHKLDEAYMKKAGPLVHDQLIRGGYLLAACLEQIFSKVDVVPPVPRWLTDKPKNRDTASVYRPFRNNTITADQAANHIGETVIVCGKVFGTKFLNNGPTFLNMGGEYPNNPFTAVIMFKDRSSFSYKPEDYLNGKMICVTGTIIEYKGKLEIIIDREDQIKLQ